VSVPRIYALVRAFRSQPATTSMLLRRPGQAAGARRLDPAIDALVEAAIGTIYLTPERPTVKRLLRQVRQDCLAAGLKAPSMRLPAGGSGRTVGQGRFSSGSPFAGVIPRSNPVVTDRLQVETAEAAPRETAPAQNCAPHHR
jgi:hypothetical protein